MFKKKAVLYEPFGAAVLFTAQLLIQVLIK